MVSHTGYGKDFWNHTLVPVQGAPNHTLGTGWQQISLQNGVYELIHTLGTAQITDRSHTQNGGASWMGTGHLVLDWSLETQVLFYTNRSFARQPTPSRFSLVQPCESPSPCCNESMGFREPEGPATRPTCRCFSTVHQAATKTADVMSSRPVSAKKLTQRDRRTADLTDAASRGLNGCSPPRFVPARIPGIL